MSYERMEESVARFVEKNGEAVTVTFKGESLREISANLNEARRREADGRGDAKLILRSGLQKDGTEVTWAHVKVGGAEIGASNVSTNCPPLPPEECED